MTFLRRVNAYDDHYYIRKYDMLRLSRSFHSESAIIELFCHTELALQASENRFLRLLFTRLISWNYQNKAMESSTAFPESNSEWQSKKVTTGGLGLENFRLSGFYFAYGTRRKNFFCCDILTFRGSTMSIRYSWQQFTAESCDWFESDLPVIINLISEITETKFKLPASRRLYRWALSAEFWDLNLFVCTLI